MSGQVRLVMTLWLVCTPGLALADDGAPMAFFGLIVILLIVVILIGTRICRRAGFFLVNFLVWIGWLLFASSIDSNADPAFDPWIPFKLAALHMVLVIPLAIVFRRDVD